MPVRTRSRLCLPSWRRMRRPTSRARLLSPMAVRPPEAWRAAPETTNGRPEGRPLALGTTSLFVFARLAVRPVVGRTLVAALVVRAVARGRLVAALVVAVPVQLAGLALNAALLVAVPVQLARLALDAALAHRAGFVSDNGRRRYRSGRGHDEC